VGEAWPSGHQENRCKKAMSGVEKVLMIEINLRRPSLLHPSCPSSSGGKFLDRRCSFFSSGPTYFVQVHGPSALNGCTLPFASITEYKTRPIPLPTRTIFLVLYLYLLMNYPLQLLRLVLVWPALAAALSSPFLLRSRPDLSCGASCPFSSGYWLLEAFLLNL